MPTYYWNQHAVKTEDGWEFPQQAPRPEQLLADEEYARQERVRFRDAHYDASVDNNWVDRKEPATRNRLYNLAGRVGPHLGVNELTVMFYRPRSGEQPDAVLGVCLMTRVETNL